MESGVYNIINSVTGCVYVGSSKCVKKRHISHRNSLRVQKHANKHLQHSWNRYGENMFTFNVLELCAIETLAKQEQYWMDWYRENGYDLFNKFPHARTSLGRRHSKETKIKMSLAATGRKASKETKEKLSHTRIGHIVSEETRKKISIANTGHTTSPETKLKMVEAKRNRSPEEKECTRSKKSISAKGKIPSVETRQKMSLSWTPKATNFKPGRIVPEEIKQKISLARKGHVVVEETRKKISNAHLALNKRGRPWSDARRAVQLQKQLPGGAACLAS